MNFESKGCDFHGQMIIFDIVFHHYVHQKINRRQAKRKY